MASAGSKPSRGLSRAAGLVLALALPGLAGASCRAKPEDCDHASIERCTWEDAIDNPASADEREAETDSDMDSGGSMSELEGDALDQTLDQMIDIMGAGLEWSMVDEQAQALCQVRDSYGNLAPVAVTVVDPNASAEEPKPRGDDDPKPTGDREVTIGDAAEVWRCALPWLEINGAGLELEATAGVISLSAVALEAQASEVVAAFARSRFDRRCAGEFEEFEGVGLELTYRCALPEGPYLVIARFPRDPEASRWQVSIAVVDAG